MEGSHSNSSSGSSCYCRLFRQYRARPRSGEIWLGLSDGEIKILTKIQVIIVTGLVCFFEPRPRVDCAQICEVTLQGKNTEYLELAHCLKALRSGDILVV